ncbi:macrophage mannose receptor 1-like [Ctenopharyngodon idella]|uniref:macrophage mannose receptor 1-like n=1 Tax=Ctenopharyngodon idella TaxID=7959 RepID=UPI00223050E7|nr:macrophage mannose receptor 1-like [Ctenopharyngodon idella]
MFLLLLSGKPNISNKYFIITEVAFIWLLVLFIFYCLENTIINLYFLTELVSFSGFISFGLSVPRHYVFVNESKTWAEAQRYCRDKYSDLATIENEQQTVQLLDTVKDDSIDLAWIGLYDDLNSWKWTLEDSDFFNDFYQEGERDYRNFNNQPDNSGGNELCVYMDYDGKWYDMSCDNTLPFICYDGKENVTQSYIRIYDWKTWSEARRYCRENYTDLANVRNQTENQRILDRTGGGGWIGLYRNRVWSDQQIASYENWKPGIPYSPQQPDNDYGEWDSPHCTAVSLKDAGRWTDENCFFSIPFFCYNRTCTQSSCTCQYHFVSENKTWFEAQRYCRQNYTDLATIDNMEEMNRLINTVNGSYNGSAWIGLYGDVNSWRWSLDNAVLGVHKRWLGQHPRNTGGQSLCVNMNTHNGLWSEAPCSNLSPFVCYDGKMVDFNY